MKFQELIILLPCHSLEDFPQHHEGDAAEGLLACWTSLWHPALLAAADSAPTWHRSDDPPQELRDSLVVIPSVSESDLEAGFERRAGAENALVIRGEKNREQILARALSELDGGDRGIASLLVHDFLALGFCFLQTQILTRQMRYSSSLDEVHFNSQLLAAAKSVVEGDEAAGQEKLTACFDLLAEERDHYYAVDAFVVDVTLVAPQAMGAALRTELESSSATNLLLSGALLREMAEHEPETLQALKVALDEGRASLIGGEDVETCLPLMSCESILAELRRGQAVFESLLGCRVEVFGRRRYGLSPLLPQILSKLGYRAACHATMDAGRTPEGSQIKTRWEGVDGSALDALGKAPLDAGRPETFLNFGSKLGESMDMDHVATLWLAHWPGHASVWYDDLRRCAHYGTALGRFMTIEGYFDETYVPGHSDRFTADQYRSPYLKQFVDAQRSDPISRHQRYWRRRTTIEVCEAMATVHAAVGGGRENHLHETRKETDAALEQSEVEGVDERLAKICASRLRQLNQSLPREDAEPGPGYLVVNPLSFVRRVAVEVPELQGLPSVERPVYAAAQANHTKYAVVDVPAMGYVWVTAGKNTSRVKRPAVPLAEKSRDRERLIYLRNEFLEAAINPTTGALQALKDYSSRGNRLSQQLAFRLGGPKRRDQASEAYSVMAADSVEITHCNAALGEVVAQGRLLDREGNRLAGFQQTFRVWRGSRVLHLEVELTPVVEPDADPWRSYYACRFAWSDELADLYRGVHQTRQTAKSARLEAPHYIEIKSGDTRTSILTAGLPFHRRVGERMLDSLLVVRGETQRRFHVGIGMDVPHPIHEAMGLLAPTTVFHEVARPPAESGWFFHLDARSVVATHWSPIVEEDLVVGFRTRLLETAGRAVRAKLAAFREIQAARQVNFLGETLADCRVDEGRAHLELSAHEWTEIEARWAE
jgi:alpha-mannosidase